MLKLLKKISLFGFILISFYVLYFKLAVYTLSQKINSHSVILLGDSQTEFISQADIYNYSIHGSPFFVHFKFVQEFAKSISGKKVIIAFNNHHLSKLYQNRLGNDSLYPGWRDEMLEEYFVFDLINNWNLDFAIPNDYLLERIDIKKNKRLIKKIFNPSRNLNNNNSIHDLNQISGYVYRHWLNPNYKEKDFIQIHYLKKLIKVLHELNCTVYLLKMPLIKEYKDQLPADAQNRYEQIVNEDLSVIQLNLDSVLHNDLSWQNFKDYGHLNYSGDLKVNNWIAKWLDNTVR